MKYASLLALLSLCAIILIPSCDKEPVDPGNTTSSSTSADCTPYYGTNFCNSGYEPVSSNMCCPTTHPYYSPTTGMCTTVCPSGGGSYYGGGGSGSTSSTSSGGTNNCVYQNNLVQVISAVAQTNGCGAPYNNFKVTVKNVASFRMLINVAIHRNNNTWWCGVLDLQPNASGVFSSCNGSGQYKIQAIKYGSNTTGCFPCG